MRNFGKVWVVLIAILVVLLLVGFGIFRWYIGGYNVAVNLEQGAEKTWADIDAALQRRLDLIPNLVNTVKGYAEHEKELFENIAKSREKYFQANSRAGKIEASNQLTGFLSRLLMLQERYPDLKANQNFLQLQEELATTENRIGFSRQHYNNVVEQYNAAIQVFPAVLFANMFGFAREAFFELEEPAAREVPKVQF